MSFAPVPPPPASPAPANGSAVTALILAALGLAGWLLLFCLLLPYEDNPENRAGKALENVLVFGLNFFLLVIGSSISGTLSFSGLLTGAVSLGQSKTQAGYIAVALGAIGLLAGAALVMWRFHLVFE